MPNLIKHQRGKLLILIVFILVTIALLFGLKQNQDIRQRAYNPGHPDAHTELSLVSSSTSQPTLNQPFIINLTATTQTNQLAGVEVHLQYNPSYLELTNVDIGDLFPGVTDFVTGPTITPEGNVSFIILASTSQPALTIGNLVQLTFTPLLVGSTSVIFNQDLTKASATDSPGVDVIQSLINLNTTITPTGTPTPTDDPSPTETPTNTPTATPSPTPPPVVALCTSPTITGDINCNNEVDIFDYNLLIENFGSIINQ